MWSVEICGGEISLGRKRNTQDVNNSKFNFLARVYVVVHTSFTVTVFISHFVIMDILSTDRVYVVRLVGRGLKGSPGPYTCNC